MLFAVGKPDTRLVASGEDGDAGGLHRCGEMHRAAVVSDKYRSLGEDGGAFARGQQTAEIDHGTVGVLPPAIGGELAGFPLFGGPTEGQGVIRIKGGEALQKGAPVIATPVLGLDLSAYADGED